MIVYVTVFDVRVLGWEIERGTDTECYCLRCMVLGEGNIERT
jgi:hypothetical protein